MWKAIFFGDIVIKKPSKKFLSDELISKIRNHNIASCNFEAPIYVKDAKPIIKIGPNIFQPVEAAQLVINAGFNLIDLANNHIYDYGLKSLKVTLDTFKDLIVIGAGINFESAYKIKVCHIDGCQIGFLGLAEYGFGAIKNDKDSGYAWINHSKIREIIEEAKKIIDVLIVQIHAGVEMLELPLPEWRQRYKELIDWGVDAIIGHHPHVPQGWEIYKGKPIFYSLGNFYFDKDFDKEKNFDLWNKGYGVSLIFEKKEYQNFEIIPIERKEGGAFISNNLEYKIYLDNLCNILKQDNYEDLINKKILNLWNERYKNYYNNQLRKSGFLKRFINYILNKPNYTLLWDVHNNKIESHFWSISRALKLLS